MHRKLALMAALLITVVNSTQIALPGCPDKCGDVEIPYPFGVGDERCFLDGGFNLTCDGDSKLWTTQFKNEELPTNQSQISRIDPATGTMEILVPVSRFCYNRTGGTVADAQPRLGVGPRSFSVSGDGNKFFTLGCNTYGYLHGSKVSDDPLVAGYRYSTGCISLCRYGAPDDVGDCSGIGCCNLTVPAGMRKIQADAYNFGFDGRVWAYNNCSYSFVAKNGWFRASAADLSNLPFDSSLLVVDWAVGDENQTCGGDRRNVCSGVNNTECVDAKTKQGYHCRCKDGYGGNPYLGCQNIDECKEGTNSCHENATCNDTPGSYTCTCNKGFQGDGRTHGKGCLPNSGAINNTLLIVCLSVSLSIIALLVLSFYLYWGSRKRKLIRLKEQFFQQNGGLLLTQQLGGGGGGNGGRMKIYTLEDLKRATNNFDEKAILGQGGFGTVYKGTTVVDGGAEVAVAIKRSKVCDQSQVEHFINEVVVLSQINHRNVVKLLGCCLETQVPLLVYEFVTNGTLSEHLHRGDRRSSSPKMSFLTRLRVAAESAGALSYLHSAASPPIIHRDVKTANILLDDRLTAKVADFGASRLVPLEHAQVTTLVQGTRGYLDPEYFHTCQLTEKSDVYSFGVVLAELLTGQKAVSFARPEDGRNLSAYFVSSLNNGRLGEVLDSHIVDGAKFELLLEFAEIARRCLNVKRDDRPSMREVAAELERMRNDLERDDPHPWPWGLGGKNEMSNDDSQYLLKESSPGGNGGDSSIASGGYSGVQSFDLISMSLMQGGR